MAQSRDPKSLRGYRHEFGSLLRIQHPERCGTPGCDLSLDSDARELAFHLIATHHGAGRPHFAPAIYDPFTDAERTRSTGNASAGSRVSSASTAGGTSPGCKTSCAAPTNSPVRIGSDRDRRIGSGRAMSDANITPVDLTNPGQFFACCGVLELAARLWPGARDGLRETLSSRRRLADGRGHHRGAASLRHRQHDDARTIGPARSVVRDLEKGPRAEPGLEDERRALQSLRRELPIVIKGPLSFLVDWFTDDLPVGRVSRLGRVNSRCSTSQRPCTAV